jgi:hypothetical protein
VQYIFMCVISVIHNFVAATMMLVMSLAFAGMASADPGKGQGIGQGQGGGDTTHADNGNHYANGGGTLI